MAETIQTISDESQFEELFNQYFMATEVFLKTKGNDMLIQFLGYHNGNVAFRIPRVKNLPDSVQVFSRHSLSTIYANLKVVENNEDTFIFIPLKFQIISDMRKGERIDTGTSENKAVIYISNIISEGMVKICLDANEKKVNHLKDIIDQDLKGMFERLRIVFIHETTIDVRMKYFLANPSPLYIRDMGEKTQTKGDENLKFYINEIHSRDFKLSGQSEFISEISIPIIYKDMIPYGYVQVNNSSPMNENHLALIKKVTMTVNEFFIKERIFAPVPDKFLVVNIAQTGIAVVFKDRRQIRYFVQNSRVVLDLMIPDNGNVTMGALVKNTIFEDNGIIKVGFEISNIEEASRASFDKFLETMKGG